MGDFSDDFFGAYFEKRCYFREDARLAREAIGLLDYERFEELLWAVARFQLSAVQIARNSVLLPEREKARLDITRHLIKLLEDGYSVAVNFAEEFSPSLARFARRIGEQFRGQAHLSIFLSPIGAPAFEPHLDAVDVIAVQVEGSKRWETGKSEDVLALRGRTFVEGTKPPLDHVFVLNPGDMLYVPRGCVHSVQSQGESPSLHISIAVETPRVAAVWEESIRFAQETDEALRASYFSDRPVALSAATQLGNPYLTKLALKRIRARQLASMPQLPGRTSGFRSGVLTPRVDQQTLLQRRPDTNCEVILMPGNAPTVAVSFPGLGAGRPDLSDAFLTFPGQLISALEFIRDASSSFSVGELPGNANAPLKMAAIRRLVQEGLLEVA